MATHSVTTFVSDLSGDPIVDGSRGGAVSFSVGKYDYVVDLTEDELDEFNEVIGVYTHAGQRVGQRGRAGNGQGTLNGGGAAAGGGRDREQMRAIRDWARSEGMSISDRGRISAEVIEAFEQAHES